MKMNHMHKEVCFLAVAFVISIVGLMVFSGITEYRAYTEREKNAMLLAADILALQESRHQGNGREEVYQALIDNRVDSVLTKKETVAFRRALSEADITPLAENISAQYATGDFSALHLRAVLWQFVNELQNNKQPVNKTSKSDASIASGIGMKPAQVTGRAMELSNKYIGVPFLFKEAVSINRICAYCTNAYIAYTSEASNMCELVISCTPGAAKFDVEHCCQLAIDHAKERHGIHVTDCMYEWSENGVCYVHLYSKEGQYLLGIRRDTGSVCFLLQLQT